MILAIPNMVSRPDRVRQHAPDVYGNEIVTYRSIFTVKGPGAPQVLLVDQPDPGSTLLPHYHASDQFQVFIDGGGKLGAHDVRPVAIHYTNKYTGYGPIVAGDQGVSYYVLRPSFDPLGPGQYLFRPDLKEKARAWPERKRVLMADGIALRDAAQLRSLAGPEVTRLFDVNEAQPDVGILALSVCLGPAAEYAGPDPASGGGQFYLVLQGELDHSGRILGPRSGISVTRDEPAITLTSGVNGAQFLVMQYPRWT